ncbi:uncharacterized protein LOC101848092 [Aplysia californica]|uniref:Uncharacterized protein LOC101848092 n=1 Tax=Aplysia californica TaxID=6500 RepID=A0ABM1AEG1_APLCA|nr:uncharacterized protein LOC101848092 [Aplysia californica]
MPDHRGLYQHMVEIELRDKSYRAEMSLEVELISNEYNRATVLVELRPVGCPKSLSAIGSSFNYVTLSWKPVPEFDMNQSYYVFYSKVSEGAWHRSHMRENNPMGDLVSWNVTGLTQDSRYVFKVVALSHGARVDDVIQNYCSKEVSEATAVLPSAETTTPEVERGAGVETGNSQSLRPGSIKNGEGEGDDEDSSGVAVPVVVCLVVGILVAVVVAAVFYRRRARRQNQSGKLCDEQSLEDMDQGEVVYANVPRRRGGDNSASPQPGLVSEPVQVQGTDQDDGRFVTEEGLVYVTVQHARQQSQKWKANKKKTKCAEAEEPVEYVRLDFEKMKSLELSGEKAGEEK